MAGSNADFNAAEFRDAIAFAMTMGAAVDVGERATFHFPKTLVYNAPADGAQVPFDPAATVTASEPPAIQVNCAIDYFDAENQPTSFGLLSPSRLTITLLDEDYAKVKDSSYVVVHGDRYNYRRTEPPSGLFDVGIYTMHFTAQNET